MGAMVVIVITTVAMLGTVAMTASSNGCCVDSGRCSGGDADLDESSSLHIH